MKIIGKVKIYAGLDGNYKMRELNIKAKFKLPNKLFRKTLRGTIASNWDRPSVAKEEFFEECYYLMKNKNIIKDAAKDMIIEYLIKTSEDCNNDKDEKRIKNMIKNFEKNFEVEVEYDANK